MQWRTFNNLCVIQDDKGSFVGFHPTNLEVAQISPASWNPTGSVLQELNEWASSQSNTVSDAYTSNEVRILSLNVAQICNLKCDYCAAGGDGTYGSKVKQIDLSKAQKQIQFFIENISSDKKLDIHFLGGEPLLYPKVIRSLCEYTILLTAGTEKKISFSTTTNGTLFNPETLKLLKDFHFAVTISIDGDSGVQDVVRPAKNGKSSSQMIETGLEKLVEIAPFLSRIQINSVFGSHNTDVVSTYRYLQTLPIEFSELNFNFANQDKNPETTEFYIQSMIHVAEIAMEKGGLAELSRISQFRRPLSRIIAETRIHSYCGSTRSLIQSDTKGDLYGCNWFMGDSTEKIGHLTQLEESLRETQTLIERNNCQSCWARHLCGGGCQAVNKATEGHKFKKDLLFCKRTKDLAATAIVHYAKSFELNEYDEMNETAKLNKENN